MLAWGLMGAGGEVLVATASAAAFGDDDGLVGMSEIVDEFAGLVVVEESADGNLEGDGLTCVAGAVGAEAVASALGFVLGVEAEVNEGVVTKRRRHEDVAAMAAIATGGTALGYEFFAAEGHAAVTAVAGLDADSRFVNKHDSTSSVLGCGSNCRNCATHD